MGDWFFILAVCNVFVRLRHFEKDFCQAGEADIQDYVPAQSVFTGIFLHTTYDYYCEVDFRTDGACSVAFV